MKKLNSILPFLKSNTHHLIVFVLFVIISVSYFYPVLEGDKIYQSDIVQYSGMAKQQNDFRDSTKTETYWTDSAFSGMPTYLLGAKYPHNYIKKVDLFLRFLPRPADYLLLYLISFYVFLLVLKLDYKLAFLGSIFFAFSTYLTIIIGAGHNSKAHAIAYMPLVLAGIILVFNNKYYKGFFLTTLALGLEICANHFQMTYYLMFIVISIGIYFLVESINKNTLKKYFKSITILFSALFLAIGFNASTIMSTYEYSNQSTRGTNEITITPDGNEIESSGLNYDYITEYSYGVFESLNLFIPRITGGGSVEELDKDSESYKYFKSIGANSIQAREATQNSPTYWGSQPIVEAPAYIGIVVFFLFILSLFLVSNKNKYWLLGCIIISLVLSYGKNISFITDFFINYFPLYNKFRAVSSIQVILELCVPVLAIYSLHTIISQNKPNKEVISALNITLGIFILLLGALYFSINSLDFKAVKDSLFLEAYGPGYLDALELDRISLFKSDLLRTFIYVIISFILLRIYLSKVTSSNVLIFSFLLLVSFDLISFNKNYVNSEDFVNSSIVEKPFKTDNADQFMLTDKSKFRVLDLTSNTTKTSYFHNSILGYHAAKLSNYNALLEFYIYRNHKPVLNMLNTKYIIINTEGQKELINNDSALGNAWFVNEIINVNGKNNELLSLDSLDVSKFAVSSELNSEKYIIPNNSKINLVDFKPNYLKYESFNSNKSFVVFSEIFYPKGWKVFVNGKEASFDNVNVALRGLYLNKGNNIIECNFTPDVVTKSSYVSIGSSVLVMLLFGFYIFNYIKQKQLD